MNKNLQVIKIGSKCIIKNGNVDYGVVKRIGYETTELDENSVLVVSGAIPLGMNLLGYKERPKDKKALQRCACVGQKELMQAYDIGFKGHAVTSQLLFTYHNFSNPEEEKNIEERLKDDVENGIVPLINYNDGIDAREITQDNDNLAAQIAIYCGAKRLLILTNDVDGLLDQDGRLITEVKIRDILRYKALCSGAGEYGTGGMKTKLEAAEMVVPKGIEMILGNVKYKIKNLINGTCSRTVFYLK